MKFFKDILRVWRITKKPSKKEYFDVVKIVGIGFLVIGTIGFAIEMLWITIFQRLF